MGLAVYLVLAPVSAAADLLKTLDCITCGLGSLLDSAAQAVIVLVSGVVGCSLAILVIAAAWFAVHPTTSLCCVGVAAAGLVSARVLGRSNKASAREAPKGSGYLVLDDGSSTL